MNLLPYQLHHLKPLAKNSLTMDSKRGKFYSPGTIRQGQVLSKEFNTWNGGHEITIQRVKEFLFARLDTHSLDTVRQNKYILKALLINNFEELNNHRAKKLLDLELSEVNVPSPNRDHTKNILTPEELKGLLPMFTTKQQLFIRFIFNTGCRVSECLGSRISNCKINPDEVEISIIGKGKKRRVLRCDKDLFGEIKDEFKSKVYLFQNHNSQNRTGRYTQPYIYKFISKLEAYSGRDFNIHRLRHSRASDLFVQGESLEAISEFLGHSSVLITAKFYLHNRIKNIKAGAI